MRGPRAPAPTREQARLFVVSPPAIAVQISLPRGRVVLGRNPDPEDVPRLRHPTVSRQHAAVEWEPRAGAFALVDLASHNGTSLDGARMEPSSRARLSDGCVVRLGDVVCVVEIGEGADDAPAVSRESVPGDSAAARALRVQIARAAADPSPALIVGPTGTGKESVAAELHRLSKRAGELVTVNCAAVSAHLFESQLFGHEKGAFTGATSAQPGLFRSAQGGTLFLDEVGEMPLELQAKLLRAVQQREVIAVGSSRAERVDVRVVAATNRDLAADVERGAFRRDLYSRLALWQVRVPPLTERRADLLDWLARLHRAWLTERGARVDGALDLDADAAEALLLAVWPENLRGLDRLVHELAASPRAEPVTAARLPAWVTERPGATSSSPAPPDAEPRVLPPAPTRDELVAVLEQNGWSVRATASHFQRDRRQIYRWMDSFGIEKRPAGA
jgi:transcriptional regulator with GAF, ATPase, and Fis domain